MFTALRALQDVRADRRGLRHAARGCPLRERRAFRTHWRSVAERARVTQGIRPGEWRLDGHPATARLATHPRAHS